MPTIHDVLGELRATSLDERDKGDKFERLIQSYLGEDRGAIPGRAWTRDR